MTNEVASKLQRETMNRAMTRKAARSRLDVAKAIARRSK